MCRLRGWHVSIQIYEFDRLREFIAAGRVETHFLGEIASSLCFLKDAEHIGVYVEVEASLFADGTAPTGIQYAAHH